MLKVKQFVFSMFQVNTYLLTDSATGEAALVDPAMYDTEEQKEIDTYLAQSGVKLTQIINTHLHLDHCFGMDYVKNKYGVPLKAHASEALLGKMMDQQYLMFGMRPKGQSVEIDVKLKDGDIINIGESRLRVIHVPGHTEGGIALYSEADKLLISGDTLFRGSVGRTDLPGGNHAQLMHSVNKLLQLPADTKVLPGHNDFTTVEYEKRHNPFAM